MIRVMMWGPQALQFPAKYKIKPCQKSNEGLKGVPLEFARTNSSGLVVPIWMEMSYDAAMVSDAIHQKKHLPPIFELTQAQFDTWASNEFVDEESKRKHLMYDDYYGAHHCSFAQNMFNPIPRDIEDLILTPVWYLRRQSDALILRQFEYLWKRCPASTFNNSCFGQAIHNTSKADITKHPYDYDTMSKAFLHLIRCTKHYDALHGTLYY